MGEVASDLIEQAVVSAIPADSARQLAALESFTDGNAAWSSKHLSPGHIIDDSRQRKGSAVVGAVIDLGLCLNLLDSRYIAMVQQAHRALVNSSKEAGTPLPRNSVGTDLLIRKLDCAVIRVLHQMRTRENESPFDTVRAAFIEGGPLYENAGFAAKNHIQICVRNIACIKGYFRLLDEKGKPMSFE